MPISSLILPIGLGSTWMDYHWIGGVTVMMLVFALVFGIQTSGTILLKPSLLFAEFFPGLEYF
jgi:hypothetical protein